MVSGPPKSTPCPKEALGMLRPSRILPAGLQLSLPLRVPVSNLEGGRGEAITLPWEWQAEP